MRRLPRLYTGNLYALTILVVFSLLTGCSKPAAKLKAEALERAVRYEQQEQYASAIIEYKNALKADPSALDVRSLLGNAYLKNNDYREAYQQFERIIQVSPNNPEAQLAVGQIFLKAGMNEDALQLAKELRSRNPQMAEARLLLANAYAAKGISTLALSELTDLLKDDPKLTAAHINLGMLYALYGKPEPAETELYKALELDPNSFSARKALAALYMSKGKTAEAENLYRAAAQSNPNSQDALLTLADFYALQHRSQESERIYKQLIQSRGNSSQSLFALARFYVSQARYEEARKLDEQILAGDPEFQTARVQLAEIALNLGDVKQAEQILAPALREHKSNSEAQTVQARILLRSKQPLRAIEVLEGVIKQENLAVAHYLLGVAYSQAGNLQRAQSEMEAAIVRDSHFTDAYAGLGQMMLNRNQPKAALEYARMALQQSPDRIDCVLLSGSAFANMGDFANAERYFRAYANAAPNSPDPLNRLGGLRILQKRYAEASAFFEQALRLAPSDLGALDGVASTLILKGDKVGAQRRVDEALGRSQSPELLDLAGKIYLEAGESARAEDVLKRSLQMSPQSYATYAQLGGLYARTQRIPEAIREFESAVKLHPTDIGSWTMLGMLYQQHGDVERAEEAYNKVLEIEPNAGVAANNLAWLYADHINDMDRALELARRAKIALPNVPNISDTLGWIYAKQHLNEMAVPLLLEAVKADPKHAEYHYHLAVAYSQEGKNAAARQEIAMAVKLDEGIRSRSETRKLLQ